jgi:cytochrome c oxidase cbb3-type subunit I/II
VLAILVGSVIEIIPTLSLHKYLEIEKVTEPYTPLELAGRDIYVKEGCYNCHSQMIRKTPSDVLRFGAASTIEESMYDRPFQWGSKRTGPDLARIGGKYPDLWHFRHMLDPRAVVPQSIMPQYSWLFVKKTDFYGLRKRVSVMKQLGVPYTLDVVANADIIAEKEAKKIATELVTQGVPEGIQDKQIVALIAFLQSLGQKGAKK